MKLEEEGQTNHSADSDPDYEYANVSNLRRIGWNKRSGSTNVLCMPQKTELAHQTVLRSRTTAS
ncbi:hypothetical protein MNBD_GAMMA19-1893 [hydrothermal vent metagenome]|uniref:Uncharacterized protein n=1 Tax=hydrothermal vent metagenome TaxID=652676 RepID=A0A3B1B1I4_9ZZZZ